MLATDGTLEHYRQLTAEVLLIYGGETDPMFVDCAEALHAVGSALHGPAAARSEPRLSTDVWQPSDDRCGAAAVLQVAD